MIVRDLQHLICQLWPDGKSAKGEDGQHRAGTEIPAAAASLSLACRCRGVATVGTIGGSGVGTGQILRAHSDARSADDMDGLGGGFVRG